MSEKSITAARRRGIVGKTFSAICLGLVCGSAIMVIGQSKQLSLADILIALRSKKAVIEEKNRILAEAVKQRGVTFALTPEIEKELGSTGAYSELIDAIRQKTPRMETAAMVEPKKVAVDPTAAKPAPTPPDFAFYRNRASAYLANSEFDLAIADLSKAIEFKPDEAKTLADRGSAYLKQNKLEQAAADLDRSLELDATNSLVLFDRAVLWERSGNTEKALALFDRAAKADPANEQAVKQAIRIRDAQALTEKKRLELEAAKAEAASEPRVVPVGALNSFAENLSIPIYSAIDKRMGVQGKVTVQISLDINGKVTSAQATDGPKTLRNAAVDAVRRSTFRTVVIQGKPVAASGFIVYNFVAN
ncbi:MAG: energy transducer TonB [Pyrinomonadaceae bacterium]|nr:energy transducer TonB [Pyrinomonadaceae bacterium]